MASLFGSVPEKRPKNRGKEILWNREKKAPIINILLYNNKVIATTVHLKVRLSFVSPSFPHKDF